MYSPDLPAIDWICIMPVLIVAITGAIALIAEMMAPKRENNFIVLISLLGLAAAGVAVVRGFSATEFTTFGDMVLQDGFGSVVQLLLIATAFLCILFSNGYLKEKRAAFGEFYPLLLWSTCGAMIMSTTTNLLMIFLGLEVLSISLYVMAGMSRSEEKSEEAALKYFLLGAFASGFLLYGIAFFFGATGSLDLSALRPAWTSGDASSHGLFLFGMAMILIGLSFKSAFVPFHQWTPDVYQGAPTNVTAFMAAGSKIGAIAALWRVLDGTQMLSDFWMPALSVVAILTMTIGNLIALQQKDAKRILGYSSIAHAGYILVGVLAHFKDPSHVGSTTVLFYLMSYALMTIGSFAVLTLGAKAGKEDTGLTSLHGLWQRSPAATFALIIFMISLVGMPPTVGFVGKFMIFNDALAAGLTPLAIVLAVNSVISIYYYLGIARAAFVSEDVEETAAPGLPLGVGLAGTCLLCVLGVFAATFLITPLGQVLGAR